MCPDFVTWRFNLYPTIFAILENPDDINANQQMIQYAEVSGWLSESGTALLASPNDISGYYAVPATNLVDTREIYRYCARNQIMALIHILDDINDATPVGFFFLSAWRESYGEGDTTQTTYRIPARLFDEFKRCCSERGISQTSIITAVMKEYVHERRYADMVEQDPPTLQLGNGDRIGLEVISIK
jgi:hypothetical protein